MDQSGAISIMDAAKQLSVSRATVDRMLRAGVLPRFKLGRRTLIRRSDCERFISGGPEWSGRSSAASSPAPGDIFG